MSAESDAPDPLAYLRGLQAEARMLAKKEGRRPSGFHSKLNAWVDDASSVGRVLTAYADRVLSPEVSSQTTNPEHH